MLMLVRFSLASRYCLLLAIACLVSLSGFSQDRDPVVDSLLQELKTAKHDTVRAKIYANLTDACSMNDILIYATPGIILCEKAIAQNHKLEKDYSLYYCGLLNNVGYYYSRHGDIPKALEYYKKAAGILEKVNNKKEAAILLNNIAYIYQNQGDIRKALEYYFKNLRVQEELKDDRGMGYSLSNIGYTYDIQGDLAKAEEYYNKAEEIYKRTGDKSGLAMVTVNRGILFKKKNPRQALGYYKKGLAIYEEANDTHGAAQSMNNVSSMYGMLGVKDTALIYAYRSLAIVEKYGYNDVLGNTYSMVARSLLETGKYAEAKKYALLSLELAQKRNSPIEIRSVANVLKDIYKKQNNFKDALATYELEMRMNDSLINESNKKESIKKQLEYDYEKKELQSKVRQEQRLSVLKLENEKRNSRKNVIVYGLIFLAVMLAVSIFYLYKFFQQKNVINAGKNNELKQKLLRTQMNPHFIFNSVDNIQSLIHNKQDKEAISYLTKFSKLTRQILENSNENYISLSEELAMTENYLGIQQLLYNNKFSYQVETDEAIDPETILLPPMLTQPFIENAIKHGLKHRESGGRVHIRFYKKEDMLFFEVTDNGSGMEVKDAADTHKSMSLHIVNERLNNNPSKKEIVVSVKNVIENNEVMGVRTSFEIPYLYDN
jgi:tetratricopeptide (TPR) repeat protein